MKLRIALGLFVLALIMAMVPNADGATTTIGSLPTNATPSPNYYLIVDDGVANTWKSTINAVIGSAIGIPVSKTNGGTGTSSPAPTASGCLSITGTWPSQLYDASTCGGGVSAVTGVSPVTVTAGATPVVSCTTCVTTVSAGANLTGGGSGPTPAAVALASPAATALPSACAGWSSTFVLNYFPCASGGGVTTVTAGANISIVSTAPTPVVALASPTASSCPSAVAGFSSSFVLSYQNGCAITLIQAGTSGNLAFGAGTGPTVTGAIASPAATAAPSACAGWSATFVLQYTNGACAIVGVSTLPEIVNVVPTATTLSTPTAGFYTHPFTIYPGDKNVMIVGSYAGCDTAGSGGGLLTWKWYEVALGSAPNTASPVSTLFAFATGSSIDAWVSTAPTALATLSGGQRLFAVVNGLPSTPSVGCNFELHLTHTM